MFLQARGSQGVSDSHHLPGHGHAERQCTTENLARPTSNLSGATQDPSGIIINPSGTIINSDSTANPTESTAIPTIQATHIPCDSLKLTIVVEDANTTIPIIGGQVNVASASRKESLLSNLDGTVVAVVAEDESYLPHSMIAPVPWCDAAER